MRFIGLSLVCAIALTSLLDARTLQRGHWGGTGIAIHVNAGFIEIEFNCAHGIITERFILDRQGNIDLQGTYVADGPGPIAVPPDIHPARYFGDVHSGIMHLTVILLDSGETNGPYVLTRGDQGMIAKCL